MKRVVFSACRRGAFVNDAQSFAAEATKHVNRINVVFIPAREIENGKNLLKTQWESVKTLPNTQTNHIVIVIDKHVVEYAIYAQSDDYQQFQLVQATLIALSIALSLMNQRYWKHQAHQRAHLVQTLMVTTFV